MKRPPADAPAVYLGIGVGAARGHVVGEVASSLGIRPLRTLRVIAEGLPEAHLYGPAGEVPAPKAVAEVWSRTIGALQEDVWARLTGLRVAVFGCGRTGSLLSNALARSGIRDLTLIDPDHLEIHNFGEMEAVNIQELGRSKVESVATALRRLHQKPMLGIGKGVLGAAGRATNGPQLSRSGFRVRVGFCCRCRKTEQVFSLNKVLAAVIPAGRRPGGRNRGVCWGGEA
jgi:hypothetical protein